MSDVLQVATRYRSRLKAELARIDEFLHMAEELSKSGDLEGRLPFSGGNGAQGNGETAEMRTVEAKASEPKPAESRPAEAKPAESKPAEAKAKTAEEPKTPFDRFRTASG